MTPFQQIFILAVLVILATFYFAFKAMRHNLKYRMSGEVCLKTAFWQCTACGDIRPVTMGEIMPRCGRDKVKWVPREGS